MQKKKSPRGAVDLHEGDAESQVFKACCEAANAK